MGDLEVRAEQARDDRSAHHRAAVDAGIRFFRKSARPSGTAEEGAFANYKEDGFFNVLNNNDSKSNAHQTHIIWQDGRLRAPTPIEWERAQGFPDNWTDGFTDSYKTLTRKSKNGVKGDVVLDRTADRNRMEALGDAMHVDTASWLGRNLIEIDAAVPLLGSLVS